MTERRKILPTISVLFVCMGNICRSPTAQGALEKHLETADLPFRVLVDSAGTHAYHAGEGPDRRAIAACDRVNIDITQQRARSVIEEDFLLFNYVLAMDKDNLFSLSHVCPREEQHRISLLMDYAPKGSPAYVPDPFYGSAQGFNDVVELTLEATEGLLNKIKEDVLGTVA
ncbi:MAG: low molecular weight protein-tyrosine-phosphatase [Gammaproteobacteria bacterium]